MKEVFYATGIAIALLIVIAPLSLACPFLECANFTGQKQEDCNYISSEGFNKDEEQQLFCALWEQEYGWEGYHPPDYPPIDPDLSLDYNEIDTSRFILASKIVLFLLFNYFLYCIITKPSWSKKWLSAV
ncbi:hypothetical protein AUJ63_02320 [Candidatus Pacearchaeota archaeon CG1_02_35_32]|nr:MAG: hypothetical protein AUJ63_02320 [Candidatus Pacearchaeota archaeon CG1_02_35_32]